MLPLVDNHVLEFGLLDCFSSVVFWLYTCMESWSRKWRNRDDVYFCSLGILVHICLVPYRIIL
jgi:hypothetical protein